MIFKPRLGYMAKTQRRWRGSASRPSSAIGRHGGYSLLTLKVMNKALNVIDIDTAAINCEMKELYYMQKSTVDDVDRFLI
jgi:hypothetical protein